MATIEFLENRLNGQKNQLTKLKGKLTRIQKAQATGWTVNPYYYSERDLVSTLRDIDSTKANIASYESKLAEAKEKSASRNVEVILNFLNDWKTRVYNYYKDGLDRYFADLVNYRNNIEKLNEIPINSSYQEYKEIQDKKNALHAEMRSKCYGVYEPISKDSPEYRRFYNEKRKIAAGEYEWLKEFFQYRTEDEALSSLAAQLNKEADAKYDDIIERTNKIVGQITDASYLAIGAKGDLNGIIIGTKGTASVNTIGAGGYNIQCYHFRTLIRSID